MVNSGSVPLGASQIEAIVREAECPPNRGYPTLTLQLGADSLTLQKWSKAQPAEQDLLWQQIDTDWQPDKDTRSLQLGGNQIDAVREALEDVVVVCRYTVK